MAFQTARNECEKRDGWAKDGWTSTSDHLQKKQQNQKAGSWPVRTGKMGVLAGFQVHAGGFQRSYLST